MRTEMNYGVPLKSLLIINQMTLAECYLAIVYAVEVL